jgi:transcription elongation factor Elf1
MLRTEAGRTPVSQYDMQIECPQCGKKMILHIGLTGDPKNVVLDCIGCHNEILPLVPGPIVGGPFPATN